MGLTVTVLGCDGSYSGPGGACSGYLLSHGSTHVWLDAGPGTLANLQQHISLRDLTAIVVTHAHPDHWTDLAAAHNALGYYFDRRALPVYGTSDTRERLRVAKGGRIDEVYTWHTITDRSSFTIDGLDFTCAVTDHPVETLGVRAEAGDAVFAYTADTGSAWSMSTLGPNISVLFSEATFPEDRAGTFEHLTASEAGASAREAGAAKLVLTHLLPGADRDLARRIASDAFGGDVDVATTHMKVDL